MKNFATVFGLVLGVSVGVQAYGEAAQRFTIDPAHDVCGQTAKEAAIQKSGLEGGTAEILPPIEAVGTSSRDQVTYNIELKKNSVTRNETVVIFRKIHNNEFGAVGVTCSLKPL